MLVTVWWRKTQRHTRNSSSTLEKIMGNSGLYKASIDRRHELIIVSATDEGQSK